MPAYRDPADLKQKIGVYQSAYGHIMGRAVTRAERLTPPARGGSFGVVLRSRIATATSPLERAGLGRPCADARLSEDQRSARPGEGVGVHQQRGFGQFVPLASLVIGSMLGDRLASGLSPVTITAPQAAMTALATGAANQRRAMAGMWMRRAVSTMAS